MKHLYLWPCDDGTYDICEDGEVIRQNMPATVILAASELLEALKECADMLNDSYECLGYAIMPAQVRNARAAIAKATGE